MIKTDYNKNIPEKNKYDKANSIIDKAKIYIAGVFSLICGGFIVSKTKKADTEAEDTDNN